MLRQAVTQVLHRQRDLTGQVSHVDCTRQHVRIVRLQLQRSGSVFLGFGEMALSRLQFRQFHDTWRPLRRQGQALLHKLECSRHVACLFGHQ